MILSRLFNSILSIAKVVEIIIPFAILCCVLGIEMLALSGSSTVNILKHVHKLHVIIVAGCLVRKYIVVFVLSMAFLLLFLNCNIFTCMMIFLQSSLVLFALLNLLFLLLFDGFFGFIWIFAGDVEIQAETI